MAMQPAQKQQRVSGVSEYQKSKAHTEANENCAGPSCKITEQQGGGGLTSKEEEDTPLHTAEHGHKALANDKGEEHVHGHIEGAGGCANLQRLNLTTHTINICQ